MKSGLLELARDWFCYFNYPDQMRRGKPSDNMWKRNYRSVFEKEKFSGYREETLFASRGQMWIDLSFSKGLPVPIITHVKHVPEALTLYHIRDKWCPNWSLQQRA